MFNTILIANRGEIACRVVRTCRAMGIRSVAVFSEADAGALHTVLADQALPIGPAPASSSYLSIPAIITAARAAGAQAIHPGYGFLSENADFADACAEAGIVLIGPPAAAMRAMGSKAAAKSLMAKAGVPLVPGYHGDAQELGILEAEAARIGFPVLIKASAGGGGRGMRIVEDAASLPASVESAAREARAAFGDGRLLIEKYLTRPRHIEIQVFADTHGNTVSLFERDCSIQRRHQKIIEEAPAPGLDPERRRIMGEAAIAAARAVAYVGAGTVEFIAEGGEFYFMEMNTRLQVEHPVTEMITGQDLVEWQLRVAAGERLPLSQDELRIGGHAIETRIYAEDPSRDFMPSIGRIAHLREPPADAHTRVDTGVREGDAISPYYDAMIAKLVVWGEDRAAALRHLRTALARYEVTGVQTNLDLLRDIAADDDFAAAHLDTGFIGRHPALLERRDSVAPDAAVWAAAALALHADRQAVVPAGDPWSPWNAGDAWRLNLEGHEDFAFRYAGTAVAIRLLTGRDGRSHLVLPGQTVEVGGAETPEGEMRLVVDGNRHRMRVVRQPGGLVVIASGRNFPITLADPLAAQAGALAEGGRLTAPIPARVTRVLVAPGDAVKRGAALLVLEAMKMELTISAPQDGVIATMPHGVDEMVQEGAELVTFVSGSDTTAQPAPGLAPPAATG